jgi:hypothetical protein
MPNNLETSDLLFRGVTQIKRVRAATIVGSLDEALPEHSPRASALEQGVRRDDHYFLPVACCFRLSAQYFFILSPTALR